VPKGEVYAPVDASERPREALHGGPQAQSRGHAGEAAFFAGCVMSTALANVDRATLRVLQRAGFAASNPAGQGCCGALHAHSGELSRALRLAQTNIAAFEGTVG